MSAVLDRSERFPEWISPLDAEATSKRREVARLKREAALLMAGLTSMMRQGGPPSSTGAPAAPTPPDP